MVASWWWARFGSMRIAIRPGHGGVRASPWRRPIAAGRIGADLIRLAVSSAHARGCERFLANVQSQNALLFQRLHWRSLEEFDWFGRPHHRMEADLAHYPPFRTPEVGFLVDGLG